MYSYLYNLVESPSELYQSHDSDLTDGKSKTAFADQQRDTGCVSCISEELQYEWALHHICSTNGHSTATATWHSFFVIPAE